MATVEAKAAPEKDVKAPPTTSADNTTSDSTTTGGDNTRDQTTDSSSARSTLVDQTLNSYVDAGIAPVKPVQEGATTGDDGFAIVDGPGDTKPSDKPDMIFIPPAGAADQSAEAAEVVPADGSKDATDVAQTVNPTPEVDASEVKDFPEKLFGIKIDRDDLIEDAPSGPVDFGLGKSYDGGFLKMNVRPQKYEVKPGETLDDIARKHLGPKATQDEIDVHVKHIVDSNQKLLAGRDADTYEGQKGEILRLPGYTTDGADLYKDHRGTTYKVTDDGKMKVSYLDGTGFERSPNEDGGITKRYFGSKPQDNYTVVLDKQGKIVSNDRVDPAHKPAQDLDTESRRLDALANKGLGLKNEREQFKNDMQEFIKTAKRNGLPESEVAQTFAEVSRILEAGGPGQPMTSRERARLAIGIMRGAAYPESGNQGAHNTCNMQVLENRAYSREPSMNARLLADVATTGKFVAADGTVVRMEPADLRAHGEGATNPTRGENVRSYASQIFQVTAGNAFHTRENEGKVPPGDTRYAQVKPSGPTDTGERLIDYNKTAMGDKSKGTPGGAATVMGINETAYLLNGKDESNVFIASDDVGDDKAPKDVTFTSAQDLIDRLTAAKAEGKPMSVGLAVFSNAEPFYDLMKQIGATPFDGSSSVESFMQDGHAVRIVGFDPKTGMAQLDNQWGDVNDRVSKPIDVYDLYNATRRVTPNQWLGRLDERWYSQTPEQNAEALKGVMGASFANWALIQEGSGKQIDERARQVAMDSYERMVDRLPANLQDNVRKTIEQYNKDWDYLRKARKEEAEQ